MENQPYATFMVFIKGDGFTSNLHYANFGLTTKTLALQQCLEEWASASYVPRKLNMVVTRNTSPYQPQHTLTILLQLCVPILKTKPLQIIPDLKHVAWVNIYSKTPGFSTT